MTITDHSALHKRHQTDAHVSELLKKLVVNFPLYSMIVILKFYFRFKIITYKLKFQSLFDHTAYFNDCVITKACSAVLKCTIDNCICILYMCSALYNRSSKSEILRFLHCRFSVIFSILSFKTNCNLHA